MHSIFSSDMCKSVSHANASLIPDRWVAWGKKSWLVVKFNPLSIPKKHAMEGAFKRKRVKHDDWMHNVWQFRYCMQQRGYWHIGHCLLRHPQPHSSCRRAPSVLFTCSSVTIYVCQFCLWWKQVVWNVSLFANQSTCSSPLSPLEVFCPQTEKHLIQLHTAEDALFQQAPCLNSEWRVSSTESTNLVPTVFMFMMSAGPYQFPWHTFIMQS